ncbi:hypothetical protein RHGRI_016533 [Rhododendron griersonianum]|uniref:Uncharacterized protein n=1 Tax=Rhododendron griersonianum TaxID=479676 RepID=A0AAV6JUI3_9ERIC|nr:hypothetical protein RHGRI_016533 [Rhododendron griersonianum]
MEMAHLNHLLNQKLLFEEVNIVVLVKILPLPCDVAQLDQEHSAMHVGLCGQTRSIRAIKDDIGGGSTPELRRTSLLDRTWEENVAESVANELVLQVHSSGISPSKSGSLSLEQPDEHTENNSKEMKPIRPGRSSLKAKKVGKRTDDKLSKPRKMRMFHNVKISKVT